MNALLITLQAIQVAFLWLHDWLPLPPLNDVAAIRRTDTVFHLVRTTLIQSVPFTFVLYATVRDLHQPSPHWPLAYLWIAYGILFLGELRAWWIPYLFHPEPERAARYQTLFGNTHSFLPTRNGIRPNTLHVLLHLCTAVTLLLLAFIAATSSIALKM